MTIVRALAELFHGIHARLRPAEMSQHVRHELCGPSLGTSGRFLRSHPSRQPALTLHRVCQKNGKERCKPMASLSRSNKSIHRPSLMS
jgi:hypothetical protein